MSTQMLKAALAATVLMTTGCLFAGENPGDISKEEAASRMNADPDVLDYCALNGWYNDGVCDTFCRQADIDCGGAGGCRENDECASGEYCEKATGACGAEGECVAKPTTWTEEYAPVCGCDGQTYGNGGEAAGSGVSIDHAGQCGVSECLPRDCGQQPDVAACPNGGGPTITCERQGGTCGWVVGPCDDDTFCGGLSDGGELSCAADEYCAYEAGDGCGFDDGGSVCRPRPDGCGRVYDPVCGCDFETYPNECTANAAGVGVYERGECEEPGLECAGPERIQCGAGEYCELYVCGDPEAGGTCQTRTQGACPDIYDPVCGCDEVTYSNGCEASRAGASIAYDGECGELPDRCDEAECGPRPGVPDKVCDDGSTVEMQCVRTADDECGWVDGTCEMQAVLCGGFAGLTCDTQTEYCHYEAGGGCGFDDGLGDCRPRPNACDANYDPVCGCDGQTYGNACEANSQGTGVQYEGRCGD